MSKCERLPSVGPHKSDPPDFDAADPAKQRSSFSLRIPSSSSLKSSASRKSPLASSVTFARTRAATDLEGFRSTRSFDQPSSSAKGATTPTATSSSSLKDLKTTNSFDRPSTSHSDLKRIFAANRSKSLNASAAAGAAGSSEAVTRQVSLDCSSEQTGGEQTPGGVWESLKARCTSTAVLSRASAAGGTGGEGCSWSFLLSLHQLIMMSNLQTLIFGARGGAQRPSIQPNEYMDSIIDQMKENMKERGLQELDLPDQDAGVVLLYDGHLSGLTNLTRRGDARLEAEADGHLRLTFAVQAKDLRCAYWWRRRRLKGEVCAVVQRIILNVQLKQTMPAKSPPQLIDFKVDEVTGVQVILHGLGPLNWLVRKALRAFLRRRLGGYLEKEGRDRIEQELRGMPVLCEEQSYLGSLLGQ